MIPTPSSRVAQLSVKGLVFLNSFNSTTHYNIDSVVGSSISSSCSPIFVLIEPVHVVIATITLNLKGNIMLVPKLKLYIIFEIGLYILL